MYYDILPMKVIIMNKLLLFTSINNRIYNALIVYCVYKNSLFVFNLFENLRL